MMKQIFFSSIVLSDIIGRLAKLAGHRVTIPDTHGSKKENYILLINFIDLKWISFASEKHLIHSFSDFFSNVKKWIFL